MIYNDKKSLVGYYEKDITPEGSVVLKDWSALGKGQGYNEQGQLQGFREIDISGNITVENATTDITYDKKGQQSGSKVFTHTTGINDQGQMMDEKLLVTTTRLDTHENSQGYIVGYTDSSLSKGGMARATS